MTVKQKLTSTLADFTPQFVYVFKCFFKQTHSVNISALGRSLAWPSLGFETQYEVVI